MQYLQNKIIIALLVIISSGITYFVAQDIIERKAKRDFEERVRIEREKDAAAYRKKKREYEEKYGERDRRSRERLKEATENSMFNKMFNK